MENTPFTWEDGKKTLKVVGVAAVAIGVGVGVGILAKKSHKWLMSKKNTKTDELPAKDVQREKPKDSKWQKLRSPAALVGITTTGIATAVIGRGYVGYKEVEGVRNGLGHTCDWGKYTLWYWHRKNIGPYGTSTHTEAMPIKFTTIPKVLENVGHVNGLTIKIVHDQEHLVTEKDTVPVFIKTRQGTKGYEEIESYQILNSNGNPDIIQNKDDNSLFELIREILNKKGIDKSVEQLRREYS